VPAIGSAGKGCIDMTCLTGSMDSGLDIT